MFFYHFGEGILYFMYLLYNLVKGILNFRFISNSLSIPTCFDFIAKISKRKADVRQEFEAKSKIYISII
jgi:hypothetical protein